MTSPYLDRPTRSILEVLEERRVQAFKSCVVEGLAALALRHPQISREIKQIPWEVTRRCCVQGYTEGLLPDQVAVLTLSKWRSIKAASTQTLETIR